MGVIPNRKMAFIFPISCILGLIFPIFITYFPKCEGKGSFSKSQIKSLPCIHCFFFQVDPATLQETVSTLNRMYLEAETLSGRTYCESCLACLTAYLSYICINTHYEKVIVYINADYYMCLVCLDVINIWVSL